MHQLAALMAVTMIIQAENGKTDEASLIKSVRSLEVCLVLADIAKESTISDGARQRMLAFSEERAAAYRACISKGGKDAPPPLLTTADGMVEAFGGKVDAADFNAFLAAHISPRGQFRVLLMDLRVRYFRATVLEQHAETSISAMEKAIADLSKSWKELPLQPPENQEAIEAYHQTIKKTAERWRGFFPEQLSPNEQRCWDFMSGLLTRRTTQWPQP